MSFQKTIILSGLVVVMATLGSIALAEEMAVAPAENAVITSDQQSVALKETDMQWAWGEVTNLDLQANTITLRYLDYETDQEKDMVLVVDEKTTFENIKDFNALKLKDTLSIDYMVGADNKNIAKNINFEKPDAISVPVLPGTVTPELEAPPVQSEVPVDSSTVVSEANVPVEPTLPILAGPTSAPVEPVQAPVVAESAPAASGQAQ